MGHMPNLYRRCHCFGKDFDQYMQRLEEVLERIKKAGLKLKASKSYLLQNEVIFLGHVVSGEGIKPSPTNVTKVVDWPTPKTAKGKTVCSHGFLSQTLCEKLCEHSYAYGGLNQEGEEVSVE